MEIFILKITCFGDVKIITLFTAVFKNAVCPFFHVMLVYDGYFKK